ncbi:MAG: HAD-IC family P-type ATPase, partial [Leptospirales bacterium]|nr:HAD-IC family P-type ATPase [Leptospirales bacterium]
GDIKVIFLDKTGTITEGHPIVTDTNLDIRYMSVVLALESASVHPIAESIKRYCAEKNIPAQTDITDIEERSGIGIFGMFGTDRVSVERPENAKKYSEQMNMGETLVEFKINGITEGFISISDKIKSDAISAVNAIKKLGIEPIMLTGDSEKTALTVAGKIGIENVISRVRPEEKLFAIQNKQKDNILTCMVGDGINDAAALKAADLGIALSTGTDLSIESADIIITGSSLLSVPDAIRISKITFKKIRQNLFWAFIYNIIALPAAFLGIMHPAIAELCMILSSINVILNSISIKNIKLGE